jgi:protein disulfide-isomerase
MKRLLFSLASLGLLFTQDGYTQSHNKQYTQEDPTMEWLTDYSEALAESSRTNKPVVLFFTGSDWCGWCKKLEREVFGRGQFATLVSDKYIFVKLDSPRRSKISKSLEQQNTGLRAKYKVRGFPSVIIIDKNENIVASTGYREGGAEKYAEHLAQLTTK